MLDFEFIIKFLLKKHFIYILENTLTMCVDIFILFFH